MIPITTSNSRRVNAERRMKGILSRTNAGPIAGEGGPAKSAVIIAMALRIVQARMVQMVEPW
jgi:hypothetical protein